MSDIVSSKFSYYDSSNLFHGSMMNIMGTRFDIVIIGKSKTDSESLWYNIEEELKRLNIMLNRFDDLSEISRINSKAAELAVVVTDEMWQIIRDCETYHQLTLGLFDITLHDFKKIKFSERNKSVTFTDSNISIDFGGYGKGYALKKIKSILEDNEVKCAYVDFGNSSILGIGHHPHGNAWKVTIENPYKPTEIVDELYINDVALSISGNTPLYSGHIIIPENGSRINSHKMLSVLSNDPLDAEVLSTALMIANKQQKEQIKKNFNIQIIKEYIL